MDFKKDNKYKVGRAIFLLGTLDVVVTAVMMFFGRDAAILWFFIGCLVMITGNAVMVSVKYKYQQALEDAPSAGQKIAWRWYDFKGFFKKKGVLGSVLFVALLVSIVSTSVFGIRAFSAYYECNGAYNGGYKYNLKLHEEKKVEAAEARAEWERLFAEGNFAEAYRKEREADRLEVMAETYLKESGDNYELAQKLRPIKEQRLEMFKNVLAVNVWVPVLFIVELITRKLKKRKKI
ncbi:MAG: hypothetical protein E7525_01830 [Ruminococcaceae bacterium]|nr:hypothetical protein [Oscillospiraceae bacterium]